MSNVIFPPYASNLSVHDVHYASSLQGYETPSGLGRSTRTLAPNPYPDQLSPEYTTAIRQLANAQSDPNSSPYGGNDIARDVRRALRAQERARMRKSTLEGSPHSRRVLVASSSTTPQPPRLSRPEPSVASANFNVGVEPENLHVTKSERVRMRSFRFPRLKDSISLPYLQNRRKNVLPQSRHRNSAASPPPVPQLPPLRTHIVPLPRFDPFSRPRADSLTSLVEARSVTGVDVPAIRRSPSTVRTSDLKRVPAVNDIFASINRQAASLGMKTCI
ncbi:hypothetical protein J3R30DRAFT_1417715 [Lentinula aciculospora]|uniref:Uncharacterized protein n=1 Tax=Lentinula aciculospora TaxID=153920 RepID=A0A9W9DTW8_9AGAR|nr:hypothetical protein J3R30DRAFT_1417715 [Lentinula aciculospora]